MVQVDKNRRRKKRYGIRDSTVQYRHGGVLSFLKSRSAKYLIVNISEIGLTFYSKEALAVGDSLKLAVEAPGVEDPIVIAGKVVWVVKSSEIGAHKIGVEFSAGSDRAKRDLKRLLDRAVMESIDVSKNTFLKEMEKL